MGTFNPRSPGEINLDLTMSSLTLKLRGMAPAEATPQTTVLGGK